MIPLTWKQLSEIKICEKAPKDGEFSRLSSFKYKIEIKIRNNRKVIISGFIVPIDNVNYAISKNVFASCFFCGKAGPESIAGLKFKVLVK